MYFRLTEALKRRFILELRRYWQYHPQFKDIVDNIQGKYSFEERPQYGIIIRTAGGNHVILAADNYIGVIESYVYQAKVQNYPGIAVEWVREDSRAIQNNGGTFPSPPGVYFLEITKADHETGSYEFYVDPLLDVYNEQVTMVDPSTAQLQQPQLDGTLRLFEMPAGFQLVEGVNYTVTRDGQGKPTGEILLTDPLGTNQYLVADYRYPLPSIGPIPLYPMHANNQVIPGVVLAFGRRIALHDRLAIVVQNMRRPAALEYGGRWELSLEFEVIARDVFSQQEIADQTVVYLWGVLRRHLSFEGIEMMEISLGGESEEVYDEAGEDYFYNSTFSLTVQTEWSVHVPLNVFLRQAIPLTNEQAQYMAGLPDEEAAQIQSNIEMLMSLNLETVTDPYFGGRSHTFELIR